MLSFGIKSEALEGDADLEDEDIDAEDQVSRTDSREQDGRGSEEQPLLRR